MSRFEKEILPFMEEEIMRKLRTYNVYNTKEYEDIRKAVTKDTEIAIVRM